MKILFLFFSTGTFVVVLTSSSHNKCFRQERKQNRKLYIPLYVNPITEHGNNWAEDFFIEY